MVSRMSFDILVYIPRNRYPMLYVIGMGGC